VWLPYRIFVQKKQVNWSGLPKKAGQVVRTALMVPVRIGATVLAIPVRLVAYVAAAAIGLLRLVGGVLGFALRIIIPAVAGALIFAVLGAIGGASHQDAEFRVPAAALIGAGIGVLYGVFGTRTVQKTIVLRPAPATAERG
jgi:hypothetical protein